MLDALVFYSLAAFVLGSGVLVIAAGNPVHSVLFLVANFLCVAVLFVTLAAEFVAVIQVLVYAGGIVVLYLFVVMLVNLRRPGEEAVDTRRYTRLGFVVAAVLLAEITAILVYSAGRAGTPAAAAPADLPAAAAGNTEQVGWVLYTDYLIPFEVASILLLVAMIGAILLARKDA